MHDEIRFSEKELEALFAKAVERLAAGDPFDTILDDIPQIYHTEIAEMLSVVEAARRLQKEAVPQPAPAKRAANRDQFLATAAEMRAAKVDKTASEAGTATLAAGWRSRARALWDQANDAMGGMNTPVWRLAPIAVILILVVTGMLSIVTAAKASVPGDITYPLKEWARSQELALAPDEEKPAIQARQEQEISKEVQQAAAKADRKNLVIEETSTLTFHGYEASRYKVGDFLVAPQYQPDPNAEVFEPMTVVGDLEPGAQVELTYRILPGQTGSQGTPLVQGVSMRVIAPPPTPTPAPTAVTPPTVTPTPACRPYTPRGWVRYTVRPGDTLSALAARGGVSVGRLMEANCLTSSKIIAGERISAPAGVFGGAPARKPNPRPTAARPRPTATPTLAPTDTPFPSATPTVAEKEKTSTPTAEPETTEIPPTETPGDEITDTPAPPTDTPSAPTDTPAPPTDTPSAPTNTPAPPTDTPSAPTDTPAPPTDTPSAPTDTPAPPTDTPSAPTDTPAPPTDTPSAPTDTPAPPTDTPSAPTDTPAPPTDTPVPPPPTNTPVPPPPTNTPVPPPPTDTPAPPTDTPVPPPPTDTPVPPPPTNTPVPPPPTNTPVPPPPTNTPVPPPTDATSP